MSRVGGIRGRTGRAVALLGAVVTMLVTIAPIAPAAPAEAAAEPLVPRRVLDSRVGTGGFSGTVRPGRTVRLTLPDAVGAGARSVALNVTATEAGVRGWVRAWPCDEPQPSTSVLNYMPGRAVPNLVVLRLPPGGVCLTSSSPVHLVADLMAWFTGDGDFRGSSPERLVDTRRTGDPLRAGSVRRVRIGGRVGIPADAAAVAVNVTAVAPAGNGYITAYPCDGSGSRPHASTMNFGAGQNVAALSITALGGGDLCIYAHQNLHLVLDTYGWVPAGGDLRVKTPARVLDTRTGNGVYGAARSGATIRVRVAGRGGVPNTSEAALLTITGTQAGARGYVSAWPCDAARTTTSVLNVAPGSSRANLALVKLSASGEICLRAVTANGSALHLVADAVGWVPGTIQRPPPPSDAGRFQTLPPGTSLPSGAQCANRVRPAVERRPGNTAANSTRGTRANARFPRADGNFVGTTDQILQWVACKWGIDEDVVRAQAAIESWWHQSTRGDFTSNQADCHPDLRTGSGQCPESIGIMQVRYPYHAEAFVDSNAIRSTAYNADYAYSVWRECFEGDATWLNTVERGAQYGAGDMWGCVGLWFAGRWRTQPAVEYIARVQDYLGRRIWETGDFLNG